MAWVTKLGPAIEQVDYRLRESAGCGQGVEIDPQADYRMDDSQAPLTWIGSGLAEFGLSAEAFAGDGDKDAARLIMSGQDPTNKDQLVDPQLRADPRAKLAAAPLVAGLQQAAAARETSVDELLGSRPAMVKRFGRLERGLEKDPHHRAPVRDLAQLARAADLLLDDLYPADKLATAREFADEKVRTGNRGYDLTMDTAKSFSVLVALAPPETAARLQETYAEAVSDTIQALEGWAAYGMRGHHGDGKTAERIETSGLLGWSMTHQTARPVGDAAPDPHLHAHVTIANMVKGVDGEWSTVGAGGRDIMRHAHAADSLMKARLRALTAERFGVSWERDEHTGAWEVAGIDPQLRTLFSKRHSQVRDALEAAGLDPGQATAQQEKLAAARSSEAKQATRTVGDLRADWREQAEAAGHDVDQVIAVAAPGPAPELTVDVSPDPAAIAEIVFDPETGITANRKSFTRADLLAAVADAAEYGLDGGEQLDELTAQVLAVDGYAVQLQRSAGGAHLSNADRFTTQDIVDAEVTILSAARDRMDGEYAAVEPETAAEAIEEFEAKAGFELSEEQREVVTRLTTTGNGVDAVIGVAGSGKTTVMEAVRGAFEAGGYRVAGASTAAVAAHHLQGETGIESTTVATWVARIEHGRGLDGVDALVVDEAAMTDDRAMARLVAAAGESGTMLIGIGDHQQLRSPGIGSTFKDAHHLVGGLTLTENRRQREETHRRALQGWRDGGRRAALDALTEAGCVHSEDTLVDTHAAMVGDWAAHQSRWVNPHDAIRDHLMLAATNADVDRLNDACQALRLESGDLDPTAGRDYRLRDGQVLPLYVGDQVMTRINDRDQERPGPSVLNGHRGVLTAIDPETGDVTVEWRESTPDGPKVRAQTMTRDYVEKGGVQRGYALTVHKAQGQTSRRTTADITGLEPTAAYSAITRHREGLHVWLTRDVLEDDTVRAELGEPSDDAEKLRRAVDAYATLLERPDPEELAIAELGSEYADLFAARDLASDSASPNTDEIDGDSAESRPQQRLPEWWQRRHGAMTATELQQELAAARLAAEAGERNLADWMARSSRRVAAREAAVNTAMAGGGEAAQTLTRRRERLADAIEQTSAADTETAAARDLQARIEALAARQREVGDRAARNAALLRLQGTSRAQLQQAAADLGAELNGLLAERDRHMAAARDHLATADAAARAAGERDRTTAEPALADIESDWDDRYSAAVTTDRAVADRAPVMIYPDPAPDARVVENRRHEAEALSAEAELRADRPKKMAAWEDRDRAAARAVAAEELQRDTAEAREPGDARAAAALDAEREAAAKLARQAERERRAAVREEAPHRDHRGPERDGPGLEM